MTEQEQRIAIAEVFWWHQIRDESGYWNVSSSGKLFLSYPGAPDGMPDYLHDLNTMHEAIMSLSQEQRMHFNGVLMDRAQPDQRYHLDRTINATAAQRAEAFLRTLGKWKEIP